jgi:outer membrane protein insertion porin family
VVFVTFCSRLLAAVSVVAVLSLSPAFAAEDAVSGDIQTPPPAQAENSSVPDVTKQMPELAGPAILDISVEGNQKVVSEHILSVISSKVGEPVDEEKLRKDAEAIYELGFFAETDYKVSDEKNGVKVVFVVRENPVVEEIKFTGNTVYSSEKLTDMIFTKPGMIFNRTFFRNDIQRIKEKYQSDGYVMASVGDVQVNGNVITVVIVEPKISQIVIQGNKITKKYVVQRYLKIKEGEIFNANKLRLTLSRLQGVGFFSDVNVNFEPAEDQNNVIVVLTVEEARTGKLGFNIAYGTQSGFGGGMSYENFNIAGKGLKLNVGFEVGDRSEYWLSFEQPYMSGKVTAWKIGGYKRNWDDLYYYINDEKAFEYERDKVGGYVGFGRKFKDDSKYNWYMLLDWHKVTNDPDNPPDKYKKSNWNNVDINGNTPPETTTILEDLGDGTYYSATASLRRLNMDEYLPYSKGDVETLNLQYGHAEIEDTSYNYLKYWVETKFYFPVDKFLKDLLETSLGANQDKPILFAARIMIGSSTGDVPYEEMYTIGGDNTLRGYDDDRYHGEQMMLGNFELRIPVEKNFSLVAFFDVGRAWRSSENVSFGSDLGTSPGMGVRVITPLGNLRLDYATGDEGRFHFGFGEMF